MPADDVVYQGGVKLPSNASTADVTSYIDGILSGSNGGAALNRQVIPTFDDLETLRAAYPSPTVLGTPPLARVYSTGDDAPALYKLDPNDGWVRNGGFDGLRTGVVSGGGTVINPGDVTGVVSLSINAEVYNRLVQVDFAALVNFGLPGDVVDVVFRRDGTALRSVRVATVPVLTGAADRNYISSLPPATGAGSYSFILLKNTSATLQVVLSKVGGGGGCTSTSNGLLSYLTAAFTVL